MFLDLRKAFDTLQHDILLKNLQEIGVSGIAITLLSNYITKRYQDVQIGNITSSKIKIQYGAPQGPILGPLLFLVYYVDNGH